MSFPSLSTIKTRLAQNWQSGLTVAFISVPLSISLSVASGAGPLPGVITGIWATLIASFFAGNNYNIIGAAGALSTVLFGATLLAPAGVGPAVLPLLAIASGLILLVIWALNLDRFLYYIPSSIMYGFGGGVAISIAASQLFDATGLSSLKRTGSFIGDIMRYAQHFGDTSMLAVGVCAAFVIFILIWKKLVPRISPIIPTALLGIVFGWFQSSMVMLGLVTIGDKFGHITPALMLPVSWNVIPQVIGSTDVLTWFLGVAVTVALISVLETLITAKIADKMTHTQSSSRRELFGLALANIGSGIMGGLPATGVFIRTGANIRAGATHKTSATIVAIATAVIAAVILPFFSYIPMVVIAAMLINTAIGLIEVERFKEFFQHEKESFGIAVLVLLITVFHDAGLAVLVGAVIALLLFVNRISHGRFDITYNYEDGTTEDHRGERTLTIPDGRNIPVVTYSIAGTIGYIDSPRHAANIRELAQNKQVSAIIIRLRNLFNIDYEALYMFTEIIDECKARNVPIYISSANEAIMTELLELPAVRTLKQANHIFGKAEDAIVAIHPIYKTA